MKEFKMLIVDTLSINGSDPIRHFNIVNEFPESVLRHSFMSDTSSGCKLMYYSQAYDGWLYLDFFEILQDGNIIVFHYKANTALVSANIIDERSFEGWTTLIYPHSINNFQILE